MKNWIAKGSPIFSLKKNIRNESVFFFITVGVLFFVCLTISWLAFGAGIAYSGVEVLVWKDGIVRALHTSITSLIRQCFNYPMYEFIPRATRPLSWVFEVVDTVFRTLLWKVFPPHPSVSLTWILTLFLTPRLLFKSARNFGLSREYSLLAVAIYLTQIGTLSMFIMLYRPGKAWVIFLLALVLNIISNKNQVVQKRLGWQIAGLTVVAILFDETGIIIPLAALCFRSTLLWQWRISWPILLVPLTLVPFYFLILPLSIEMAGYPKPDILSVRFGEYYSLAPIIIFKALIASFGRVLSDGVGRLPGSEMPSVISSVMHRLNVGFLVFLCGLFVLRLRSPFRHSQVHRQFFAAALCFVVLGVVHAALMYLVKHPVWGTYWYGSYFGLLFALTCGFAFQIIDRPGLAVLGTSLLIYCTVSVFPPINAVFRDCQYYPYQTHKIIELYAGSRNAFEFTELRPKAGREMLHELWIQKEPSSILIRREDRWLPIELGWRFQRPAYSLDSAAFGGFDKSNFVAANE